MQGVILIDKPAGWTSFDVVNYIRKMVAQIESKKPRNIKVGHTGTLDPLATGLLVILVGKQYTRRAQEWSKLDKVYSVTAKLGQTSTTADEEGEKTQVSDVQPTEADIKLALAEFTGELMQTPPIYSAMKINGQRAYQLARQGKAVVMEPRPTIVHSNTFDAYEYPLLSFTSHVGSGTYIRSLVEDIGQKLQTGAYMSNLQRTKIGNFLLEDAATVSSLQPESLPKLLLEL